MNSNTINFKKVVTYAGAFIAFLIGSGFATGQEVLQYFTSYGYLGVAGGLVTLVLLWYVGVSFITAGFDHDFKKGSDIFNYYCGKKLGTFFDYFSILFIYLSFIVMVAGASATFNQHFGIPNFVGGVTMAVLACITVLLGLNKLVDIIGKIGPTIVIISIVLGIVSIFGNLEGLKEAAVSIPEMKMTRASTNWLFAAGSYVGFCMLWLAGFLASIGSNADNRKELVLGASTGAIGFSIAVIIVALGLMAHINDVSGSQIPALILAAKVHPLLATLFSIIIVAGIYTTAVPLLWSVSSRFAVDKSKKFKLLTVFLASIGLIVGTELNFSLLVNIVYVINGYVGILLLGLMFVKSIRNRIGNKDFIESQNSSTIENLN
jgi:uncharacterized membrane protein YkvI